MTDSIPLDDLVEVGQAAKTERRDAAANRALILETAEKLFAERGVAEVSMSDIAQAADVGKGTLYRRFSSKADLCLALLDTQMADFQNGILDRMRQLAENEVPFMEQLDQFLDSLVYFTDRHNPLLCEVQRQGLLEGGGVNQQPHFWQHMTINGLLSSAISAGEVPEGLDAVYLSDAILATLRANVFNFQRQGRGFSLERISAGLRQLVKGLAYSE